MDLKLLREATRPEHEATEAAVPLMGPDLTRTEYVAVLQRFHAVVCAWDSVAAAEAPAAYADLVKHRSRCQAIESDLRFFGADFQQAPATLADQIRGLLGTAVPGEQQSSPAAPAPAQPSRDSRFLGVMYVFEGSTLGGQYIAHHVEAALALQPGEGNRFFRGYGKDTMPMWREFQQVLIAIPEEQSSAVIDAAKGMFGIFRGWMANSTSV